MKKQILLSVLVIMLLLVFCSALSGQVPVKPKMMDKSDMKPMMSMMDLRVNMRMLWDDHVSYTRNFIISSLGKLDDAGPVAQRLLRNQEDIGNAIKPFYGDEAGMRLTALLKDHINLAATVVTAAMGGEKDALEKSQAAWKANAMEIATFLSGANPNWSKVETSDMLDRHLSLTTDEVVNRLKGNWEEDIMAYDKGHQHMMMFADFLTNGIIKQFPAKFAGK